MTATVSNLPYILKTIYPKGLPKDVTYQDFPFLSLIARNTNFYGENMAVPLKYGNNSGRSATFSTAQTNSDYTKGVKFVVTRNSDYAIAQISNELLEASERDPGAFVAALKQEVDGAMKAAVISEALSLAEDGTGYIARMAASVNVATAVVAHGGVRAEGPPAFALGKQDCCRAVRDAGLVEGGERLVDLFAVHAFDFEALHDLAARQAATREAKCAPFGEDAVVHKLAREQLVDDGGDVGRPLRLVAHACTHRALHFAHQHAAHALA